jgi:PHD/YefM family antitoxin component YafN of YafNO toxin-antitoxin module
VVHLHVQKVFLGHDVDALPADEILVRVKRAGIPAAILLSVPDYKDLEELVDTWYEQQDPTFQASLVKARQEIEAGKIVTLDELRRDLEAKEHRRKTRS